MVSIKRGIGYLILVLVVVISLSGCSVKFTSNNKNGGMGRVDKKVIDLGNAKESEVQIKMAVGELTIDKSTDKMMDGSFTYTKEDWKPEVGYSESGDKGIIDIKSPSDMQMNNNISIGKSEYTWDLAFNKDIPMDMNIDMGVGEAKVNLQELNMRNLYVKTGVGAVSIDISGKYKNDVNVSIEGGIGKTTVYVPKDIGVKIKANNGIGGLKTKGFIKKNDEYVNDSYGKTQNNIIVDVKVGIGDLEIKLK
ncbi:toast rack family protein [Candidatus Clostridium radicumherbarum]|uniref:Toast rack family protein n=1 Tax=Candidatus Clostridium radicumherbarum TaxID=3381662 RepID=A0ABW8TSA9_9CLOT